MGVVGHKNTATSMYVRCFLLCRDVLFGILFLDKYAHFRFRFFADGHQCNVRLRFV
jgi:hypothetical protein